MRHEVGKIVETDKLRLYGGLLALAIGLNGVLDITVLDPRFDPLLAFLIALNITLGAWNLTHYKRVVGTVEVELPDGGDEEEK